MQYTLDSLRQVERALLERQENRSLKIYSKPVIYVGSDLNKLKETDNRVFFGVLTVGDGNVAIMSFRENEFLPVDDKAQIIEVFTNLDFQDLEQNPIENPKGLFRGFEIQLQNQ